MESLCLMKHKRSLLIFMMLLVFMVDWIQGTYVELEDERKALLQIKASLADVPNIFNVEKLLPTWVDHGGKHCEWERVKCNTTSGYVTDLPLGDMFSNMAADDLYSSSYRWNHDEGMIWPLNISFFIHFKELRTLDLSWNYIGNTFMSTELERLPGLKKLETLNLSCNFIETNIFSSLSELTSLTNLDLSFINRFRRLFLPTHDISEFRVPENLEVLNLSGNGYFGTLQMQGSESVSISKKLKILILQENQFNESVVTSLSALGSLQILDLSSNLLSGLFLFQALASFHRLQVIDFSDCSFVGSIPSTIKSLSFLKAISLKHNLLSGSLPDGFCDLRNLRELDLSYNMFDGNLPTCFNRLSSLKYFDISSNQFTGIIQPSLILNLTSLEYVEFSHNKFEGSLSFSLFSNHSKLKVVEFVSDNDVFEVETEEPIGWTPMFQLEALTLLNCNINRRKGNVIPGFLLSQHKLKELDMSHNSLNGQLPNWLIRNNTMLEILSIRDNSFDGTFRIPFYRNSYIRWLNLSGNRIKGTIPEDIRKFLPYISYLNLSRNFLDGNIPSSISDLGKYLDTLDLSQNKLFGEVPTGLFTNLSKLFILKLSKNSLDGEILSGNLSSGPLEVLHLDNNCFTGEIGNKHMSALPNLRLLDISNNRFTALIPSWISNMSYLNGLTVRNNWLGGQLPCVASSLEFLDISQNHFSGSIPSCLKLLEGLKHFYLGGNKFTGSIPKSFGNLTKVLALDIGQNYLTGKVPDFIGNLSNLRVLVMGKNKFRGYIPKQLCQLVDLSLIDLSSNFLSGPIPSCLKNITRPSYQAFIPDNQQSYFASSYSYKGDLERQHISEGGMFTMWQQDQVMFTTKSLALNYKGGVLDIMSGLDLSCNKLTGDIPEELGLLTEIRVLNLSFNLLTGTIPANFSNLINIESLDLSSNNLTGNIPSELIKLNSLASFNVSYNNLSGRLPEMKAQFSTFTKKSYEGNPLLCGPPLENDCTNESHPSTEDRTDEKWFDDHIDMASFKGSFGSALFVFVLGFVALLYINPYWRRRWLDFVEECMYTFFYLFYDFVMKPFYSIN
ncbi:hypothetical protein QVD17_02580 [Tagetes erecta]|uniref:Leucine-rich repeat-containing N-terminal plant-type domain-containing protein n=1 Tax=Tagetes erecta TaxID=13708 RepID=A0AAD8LE75_TARER|nr:hypothetical protein QVD17_02580 [Tagetes erecta]